VFGNSAWARRNRAPSKPMIEAIYIEPVVVRLNESGFGVVRPA
jgi:hypothetical protein